MGRPKPVLTLVLKPGTDVTTVIPDTTEDTTDMADTTDTLTDMDTDTVTWENAPLMPNQPLLLNLKLMLNPKLGTDITMVDITDIPTTTDTTDILMDTTILERDPLTLNPKLPLKLPQKPKPNPGTDTTVMVDTTDIPVLTMVVTGGNFLPFPKFLPFFNPLVSFL